MTVRIYTAPENYESTREALQEACLNNAYQVHACDALPPQEKTGKFILADGRVVERAGVRHEDRFCSYGPEDTDLLLFLGLIEEHYTTTVLVFDEDRVAQVFRDLEVKTFEAPVTHYTFMPKWFSVIGMKGM